MKKKLLVLVLIITLLFSFAGCNNKEQEEEIVNLKKTIEEKEESYKILETEYTTYKERMKPFEELEEAEAQKKLEEAAAEKKAKEDAEAQAKADAEAAKAAEEAKGYDTGITYDQLARTPDDYAGQKVKFAGKVIQVMEGDKETQIRFAVDGNYKNIILCSIGKEITANNRVLENDQITISGLSLGLYTYKSTMGGDITIPAVIVSLIDR